MKKKRNAVGLPAIVGMCVLAGMANPACSQELFSKLVGPTPVKPVESQSTLRVPYITWGGDVATFHANGGLDTAGKTNFANRSLKVKLAAGDDFVQQVRDYMGGKTPFLRGTMRMLGQASEVIGSDPRTKPVIIMQISWSAGDHVVAREGLKTLNDLKRPGKKVRVACQQGGPHVGLLYDVLTTARIQRDDIEIIFVPDLTGDNGPAERFRKDPTIDACCVITPDMIGLTGGEVGTGAEGTVKGAHVLVSTQQARRSIADVYAVRSDWYNENRDTVSKFVAGYLASAEQVVKLRDEFEKTQRMAPAYRSLLTQAQTIFGKDVLPTLEVDAHGLLLDCTFTRLKGQIAFFKQSGNLSGFNSKMKDALDVAVGWGYAEKRRGFDPITLDYKAIAKDAGVKYEEPEQIVGAESTEFNLNDPLIAGKDTIVSFTIAFEPNQFEFPIDRYRADFEHALKSASTFGGATVMIRGHSDPTKSLVTLIRAGMEKGVIRQTGNRSSGYKYFVKTAQGSRELDVNSTQAIMDMIESGQFESKTYQPSQVMQSALNLSQQRAETVKKALESMARAEGINVNLAQLRPVGVGIADPLISKPTSPAEAAENRRVEFRIIRVNSESEQGSDFDF